MASQIKNFSVKTVLLILSSKLGCHSQQALRRTKLLVAFSRKWLIVLLYHLLSCHYPDWPAVTFFLQLSQPVSSVPGQHGPACTWRRPIQPLVGEKPRWPPQWPASRWSPCLKTTGSFAIPQRNVKICSNFIAQETVWSFNEFSVPPIVVKITQSCPNLWSKFAMTVNDTSILIRS